MEKMVPKVLVQSNQCCDVSASYININYKHRISSPLLKNVTKNMKNRKKKITNKITRCKCVYKYIIQKKNRYTYMVYLPSSTHTMGPLYIQKNKHTQHIHQINVLGF